MRFLLNYSDLFPSGNKNNRFHGEQSEIRRNWFDVGNRKLSHTPHRPPVQLLSFDVEFYG